MSLKIIAELGINHQGDMKLIPELVRQAKFNGADAVKVQLYKSQDIWGDDSRKYLEWTQGEFDEFLRICTFYNIEGFASCFNQDAVDWCSGLKSIKVAFRDVGNSKLCLYVSNKNFENVYYTGWSEVFDEVKGSLMPTKYAEESPGMRFEPDGYEGLSDHTYGISFALHCIAHGATIIEKHFALSKQNFNTPTGTHNDNVYSMDAEELRILSTYGRELERISRYAN